MLLFRGKRATLQIWHDILRIPAHESVYDIEGSHHFFREDLDPKNSITNDDFIQFAMKRIQKKIHIKFVSSSPSKKVSQFYENNLMGYSDALYIPQNSFPYPAEIGVYSNRAYLLLFENPVGVIIENKLIADSLKVLIEKFFTHNAKRSDTNRIVVDGPLSKPDRINGTLHDV